MANHPNNEALLQQLQAECDAMHRRDAQTRAELRIIRQQHAIAKLQERRAAADAQHAQNRLAHECWRVSQTPVEQLFPGKLGLYHHAVQTISTQIADGQYICASAMAESALLGVGRLENDLQRERTRLTQHIASYADAYRAVCDVLREEMAHPPVCQPPLRLDADAVNYFSDGMLSEIAADLSLHATELHLLRDAEAWLRQCSAPDAFAFFQQQANALAHLPDMIRLYIRYAYASAQAHEQVFALRDAIGACLAEQGCIYESLSYAPIPPHGIASAMCLHRRTAGVPCFICGELPDLREERRLSYRHGDKEHIIIRILPQRIEDTVSNRLLLRVRTPHAPEPLTNTLLDCLHAAHIAIEAESPHTAEYQREPMTRADAERMLAARHRVVLPIS